VAMQPKPPAGASSATTTTISAVTVTNISAAAAVVSGGEHVGLALDGAETLEGVLSSANSSVSVSGGGSVLDSESGSYVGDVMLSAGPSYSASLSRSVSITGEGSGASVTTSAATSAAAAAAASESERSFSREHLAGLLRACSQEMRQAPPGDCTSRLHTCINILLRDSLSLPLEQGEW